MNNIFVGNIPFEATKEDIVKLFEPFGTVANVAIAEGKKGKSRGFCFVNMPNEAEKNAAIAALNGKEFMWRIILVNPVIPKVPGEARPKKTRFAAKTVWKSREGVGFKKSPRAPKPLGFKPVDSGSITTNKSEFQAKPSLSRPGGKFKMALKVNGKPKSIGKKVHKKTKLYYGPAKKNPAASI